VKQWKLSPIDLPSRERWYDYSRARDDMFAASDTAWAPWHLVRSDDKRRARLNVVSHLLASIPYERVMPEPVALPERDLDDAYDDEASLAGRGWIAQVY
jgi:hypothetical protein